MLEGKQREYRQLNSKLVFWQIKQSKLQEHPDFVCLSPCFFKKAKDRAPPTADEVQGMVLVKSLYVQFKDPSEFLEVWNDHGTHAAKNLSLFTGPDGVGLFGFPNYNTPAEQVPVLDVNKGARILSWTELQGKIESATSLTIPPANASIDRYVLTTSMEELVQIRMYYDKWVFQQYTDETYDCDDFAAEMRAAVARYTAEKQKAGIAPLPQSAVLGVSCFCGIAMGKTARGLHALNIAIGHDSVPFLFEPQGTTSKTCEFPWGNMKPIYSVTY